MAQQAQRPAQEQARVPAREQARVSEKLKEVENGWTLCDGGASACGWSGAAWPRPRGLSIAERCKIQINVNGYVSLH